MYINFGHIMFEFFLLDILIMYMYKKYSVFAKPCYFVS